MARSLSREISCGAAEPRSRVAGKLAGKGSDGGLEVKVDAEGGLWTIGWVPAREGFFGSAGFSCACSADSIHSVWKTPGLSTRS